MLVVIETGTTKQNFENGSRPSRERLRDFVCLSVAGHYSCYNLCNPILPEWATIMPAGFEDIHKILPKIISHANTLHLALPL
jgi:hypothetical protein